MLTQKSQTINNSEYTFETGVWAKQAGGSVLLKWGDLVLMSNATAAKSYMEGIDFFPLTVDYREKFYAGGMIPGGFFKREARPSTRETLTSRQTDRPLRPLFPSNFKNETQIFINLLSTDKKTPADIHAINVASASLMVSNIPFNGPVGAVRIGRVEGEWIIFPNYEQIENADINLSLAGTRDAITMIEGLSKEVSEEEMLVALKKGHEEIIKLCELQEEFAKAAPQKEMMPVPETIDTSELTQKISGNYFEKLKSAINTKEKLERYENINKVKAEAKEFYEKEFSNLSEEELPKQIKIISGILNEIEVQIVRDQIFDEGLRADGRKLEEIRKIDVEIDLLPGTHGSALFTRGETQSLGVLTLGTGKASQEIDNVDMHYSENFYLHYNFLPFSVGEVRRYGGPGRREIGHGKLAENALRAIIPAQEDFKYVIRLVSEILESNGSSSMATVCSGTLALMAGGVPIKAPVAGIAMGLITKGDKFAVLSDIAGLEDHFGDMDFKVAGSKDGITAFQMDCKVEGVSYEIMEKALFQAKEGRMHILDKMMAGIEKPREELSDNAPRISTVKIAPKNIGLLIGPGGKNIKAIIEKTGADISVEDDGTVSVVSADGQIAKEAVDIINAQFEMPEVYKTYEGTVKNITDFGAFIEILPGKEGLCHISKISSERVNKVADHLEVGQVVKVKVLSVDRQNKISLSIKDAE